MSGNAQKNNVYISTSDVRWRYSLAHFSYRAIWLGFYRLACVYIVANAVEGQNSECESANG